MSIELITRNVNLLRDLIKNYNRVGVLIYGRFTKLEDYTLANYDQLLKDLAGSMPSAYIFLRLASDEKYSTLFQDILQNHPEVISILAAYFNDPDFKQFFQKLPRDMGLAVNLTEADLYLFPLRLAITKLNNHGAKQAYSTYYAVLKNEIESELAKGNKTDYPKINYYRLIGVKYFELANVLLSNADEKTKQAAINKAYQFSTPSWMPLPLKIAAVAFITAVGAVVGFAIGVASTGGIAAIPAAIKGAMLASTWTSPVIVGSVLGASYGAMFSAFGLFCRTAFQTRSEHMNYSLKNSIRPQR